MQVTIVVFTSQQPQKCVLVRGTVCVYKLEINNPKLVSHT